MRQVKVDRNHVLLSPAIQLASAVCLGATAVIAAHRGQFVDIGAYSAGVAIAAVVSVLVGGGTSLAYVTGDQAQRAAVRSVRWRFIAPFSAMVSMLLALGYWQWVSDLPVVALILGTLSVVLMNLASLDVATLQREQKIAQWGLATLAGRIIPLAAVWTGGKYSFAMILGSSLMLFTYWGLAKRARSGPAPRRPRVSFQSALKKSYVPSLAIIALLDISLLRSPFVFAPLVTSPTSAGAISTLLNAQQSIAVLVTSSLYTIMTVRGKSSAERATAVHERSERLLVIGSIPASLTAALLVDVAVRVFAMEALPDAKAWWVLLMLAIGPMTINRAAQYRALTEQRRSFAARLLASICLATVTVGLLAIARGNTMLLASAPLFGEMVGLVYFGQTKLMARTGRARERSIATAQREG